MKITRIIPLLDFGGVEQRIKLTTLGFKHRPEIQLQIVVLGQGGRIADELQALGFKIHILDESIRIPNIQLIRKLVYLLKKHKPDIVHTSGAEANFHGLWAAKLAKIPVRVGEEIGFPNHGRIWRSVFKVTYTTAHAVIGISSAVISQLVALGELPLRKARVVYNPVAIPDDRGGLPTPEINGRNNFVFITTCRLVAVKNIDFLLRVFREVRNECLNTTVLLWIVGSGPEQINLEETSKSLGLDGCVRFFGFQKDVFPYLRQADAFVLPSFSEGFSISLVEAMLMGLPSIATKIGGPSEIIENGKNGFLVDPTDKEGLKVAMTTIVAMGGRERQLLKNNAIERGRDFSVDAYVTTLSSLYLDLTSRHRLEKNS